MRKFLIALIAACALLLSATPVHSSIPIVTQPGANGGSGWTIASLFLTQVVFVDPTLILQNAANPAYAESASVLKFIADQSMFDPLFNPTNQSIYALVPSNNTHYYISHATYWWPDPTSPGCDLNDPWHMHHCNVIDIDGQFSPDDVMFYTKANFINQATDSLALALGYLVFQNVSYIRYAAKMTDYWYINETNYMYPDFSYVQVKTGPTASAWKGGHSGILDMRWLMYVDSVLSILSSTIGMEPSDGLGPIWTLDQQSAMQTWFKNASHFMSTASIALQEAAATNNHGTWQAAQNAAYAYYGGDSASSAAIITQYLNTLYQGQFAADGSQPLEINVRSRPMHYTLFNIEPLIYMAKLGEKIGLNVWNWTSPAGTRTIQSALDYFLVSQTFNFNGETDVFSDAIMHLYEVRAHYGDTPLNPTLLAAGHTSYSWFIANYTNMQINAPLTPLLMPRCTNPLCVPPTSVATVTPTPNTAGWINQDAVVNVVSVDASTSLVNEISVVVDGVSQYADFSPAGASETTYVAIATEGIHVITYSGTNTDGDQEDINTLIVKLDKTAPIIVFTDPSSPSLAYDIASTINIQCSVTDGLSGVANSVCPSIHASAYNFPLAPTSTQLTANAMDFAGNSASTTVSFTVRASYNGLCTLVGTFTPNRGVDASLCAILQSAKTSQSHGLVFAQNAKLDAFILEVDLLRLVESLTSSQANVLVAGARSLLA